MNKKMVIIATIVIFVDQILKAIIQAYDTSITVIKGFFNISYYQNTGAAWSILEGKQSLLIIIALVILVLVYSMTFSYEESKLNNTSFGLLFGGIIGNMIDRMAFGYVRDFIDFKIFGYDYPVFNIADMAIVIGVVILIISTIKGDIKNGNTRRRKLNKN